MSSQPSLLHAEQAQLPQPVFTREVLQSPDHLCGSSAPSPTAPVFFLLGAPDLDLGDTDMSFQGRYLIPHEAEGMCAMNT